MNQLDKIFFYNLVFVFLLLALIPASYAGTRIVNETNKEIYVQFIGDINKGTLLKRKAEKEIEVDAGNYYIESSFQASFGPVVVKSNEKVLIEDGSRLTVYIGRGMKARFHVEKIEETKQESPQENRGRLAAETGLPGIRPDQPKKTAPSHPRETRPVEEKNAGTEKAGTQNQSSKNDMTAE